MEPSLVLSLEHQFKNYFVMNDFRDYNANRKPDDTVCQIKFTRRRQGRVIP